MIDKTHFGMVLSLRIFRTEPVSFIETPTTNLEKSQ